MNAWVMYCKDYNAWISISDVHYGFQTIYQLPLFSINPSNIAYHTLFDFVLNCINDNDNELILVVDRYVESYPFTLQQVEEINKTWNKFYES